MPPPSRNAPSKAKRWRRSEPDVCRHSSLYSYSHSYSFAATGRLRVPRRFQWGREWLEAPSSKLQKNSKPQLQKQASQDGEAANTNKECAHGGTRFPRRLWSLGFGVFLDLGTWCLELCQSAIP